MNSQNVFETPSTANKENFSKTTQSMKNLFDAAVNRKTNTVDRNEKVKPETDVNNKEMLIPKPPLESRVSNITGRKYGNRVDIQVTNNHTDDNGDIHCNVDASTISKIISAQPSTPSSR